MLTYVSPAPNLCGWQQCGPRVSSRFLQDSPSAVLPPCHVLCLIVGCMCPITSMFRLALDNFASGWKHRSVLCSLQFHFSTVWIYSFACVCLSGRTLLAIFSVLRLPEGQRSERVGCPVSEDCCWVLSRRTHLPRSSDSQMLNWNSLSTMRLTWLFSGFSKHFILEREKNEHKKFFLSNFAF